MVDGCLVLLIVVLAILATIAAGLAGQCLGQANERKKALAAGVGRWRQRYWPDAEHQGPFGEEDEAGWLEFEYSAPQVPPEPKRPCERCRATAAQLLECAAAIVAGETEMPDLGEDASDDTDPDAG